MIFDYNLCVQAPLGPYGLIGETILFYEPLLNNELQGMCCELLAGGFDCVGYGILVAQIELLLRY